MPRFSANLGFLWADLPLPERIARAGRAGFKAIEMHFPYDVAPEETAKAAREAGVEILALNTEPMDCFGLGAQPGREAEFRTSFAKSLDYCRVTGAKAIHVMAGVVTPTLQAEVTGTFADNLRFAVEQVGENGPTLLLEPLNPADRPGYFYSTLGRAEEMILRVGSPKVRIMFDVYNIAVAEGDVLRRLKRHFPHVGHVQIAAVPTRQEPDDGEIDYRRIFAALDAIPWTGWVGAEYRPKTTVEAGLAWMAALGVSPIG